LYEEYVLEFEGGDIVAENDTLNEAMAAAVVEQVTLIDIDDTDGDMENVVSSVLLCEWVCVSKCVGVGMIRRVGVEDEEWELVCVSVNVRV
jgi:hypothetical protein